jgi:hypothetical protein
VIAWWSLRPRLDWLIALVAVVGWLIADIRGWTTPLDSLDADTRRAVYTQAGTIGAAAIGLFVVPVSLALALAPRERLERVLSHKRGQLRRAVMQAGAAAVVLIVFTVVAVALDTAPGDPAATPPVSSAENEVVRLLAPGVLVVTVLGLLRVLRVLGALLRLNEVEGRPSMSDHIRPVGQDEDRRSA